MSTPENPTPPAPLSSEKPRKNVSRRTVLGLLGATLSGIGFGWMNKNTNTPASSETAPVAGDAGEAGDAGNAGKVPTVLGPDTTRRDLPPLGFDENGNTIVPPDEQPDTLRR